MIIRCYNFFGQKTRVTATLTYMGKKMKNKKLVIFNHFSLLIFKLLMNMSLLVRFKYFFSLVSEAFINILYLSLHILLTVRNENKKAKDFEFIKQLVI